MSDFRVRIRAHWPDKSASRGKRDREGVRGRAVTDLAKETEVPPYLSTTHFFCAGPGQGKKSRECMLAS
jgi:hypothetical protein